MGDPMHTPRSVYRESSRILAEMLRAGSAFGRWGMERRELTRWQRLCTRLRRVVGLPPLERDEEWFVKVSAIPSGDVLRFRRPAHFSTRTTDRDR